jgi:hypothetical protein
MVGDLVEKSFEPEDYRDTEEPWLMKDCEAIFGAVLHRSQ